MTKFLLSLAVLALLTGCASVKPAKSRCFSMGAVSCHFTPIDQLWGASDAAPAN
ncbi:hypothetical protein [Brucella intermedia]|uniref:hypothetical protein n=1 Tax=Brucella intermedia TaxID=94625 RepID=UPI00235E1C6E|nr:hypothetical protein [Brucella intermedia]